MKAGRRGSFASFPQLVLTLLGSVVLVTGMHAGHDVDQPHARAQDCGLRAQCDITLVKTATLSGAGRTNELPQSVVAVSRDRQGRFFVTNREQSGVLVFDTTGRLIRTLGSRGTGAGQFQAAGRVVVAPDESIWVFDHRLMRLTQFSAKLEFVRSREDQRAPALILADGTVIVAEQIQDPEVIGYPIHSFSPEGRRIKSFGIETPQYRSDLRLLLTRRVALGSGGTVWSVAPGRYHIDQWNPNQGTRLQQVAVQSSWFKEIAKLNGNETVRPRATIESLWEHDGLVWVLLRDADSAWKPPAGANTERVRSPAEYGQTYDRVIEAIDPKPGRVVASKRFPSAIWAGSPAPLVSSLTVSGSDLTGAVDVWSVQLVGRENRQ